MGRGGVKQEVKSMVVGIVKWVVSIRTLTQLQISFQYSALVYDLILSDLYMVSTEEEEGMKAEEE